MKAEGWHRELWNWLFWFGSFLASFAQGVMLGRYITGFEPGFGYWLFALMTGAALCGGYVLLGATWLIARTEGALQRKSVAWARWGLAWVALGVALVSLATPLVSETVRDKWFRFPADALADAAAGRDASRPACASGVSPDACSAAEPAPTGRRSPARWRFSCSPSPASPTASTRGW